MSPDDLTTPLDGVPLQELPTINRPAGAVGRTLGGFAPGTIVGARYRIVALLGRGGMGEVYRADDLRLGQPVALKFVDLGSDAQSVQHLYHEVRVARQVSHPNVCRVHDVVEADGHRFIAMEYVDGEDLASLLRRIGRLPPAKATDIVREIASGLAAAHDRGIIHRDLKPANVMIDGSGRAHVTDFGLASLAGAEDGRIAGTPAYMAPEQVVGQPVTPRSDVYALGLILYELFTGERVYASSSYADRRQQRVLPPPRLSVAVKDIDPAIEALVQACLAEDAAQRPANARAVLALLPGGDAIDAAMAAGETPSPEMVAAASETGYLSPRLAWSLVAAIAAAVVVAAFQLQSSWATLMRKPPAVFEDHAEDVVTRAGETVEAHDSASFYDFDRTLLRSALHELPRAQLAAIRPGIMRFVYRRSPERMAPRETIQVANDVFIFQSGRVTLTDPPLEVPGDAVVILDHHRGLVQYRALPSGASAATDWSPLLAATGIEMQSLAAIPATRTPPVPSDAHTAWTAIYPGRPERVRIEAASLRGRPAWLQVFPSWEEASKRVSRAGTGQRVVLAMQLVIMLGITIIAVVVTRRSLRRGRSDTSGAFRFALYIGGCLAVAWLIGAHHVTGAEDEARMLAAGVGQAISAALILWVFYIALEPGVRRIWPRALIGWTRLLSGRAGDAMVAREVLFGIAGGLVSQEVFWLVASLRARLGRPSGFFLNAPALDPFPLFAGNALISHVQMIEVPIGTIFVFLLLRKGFGRMGSAVAFAVLAAAYVWLSPAVSLYLVLLLFVILRFGLLAGVVMSATLGILQGTLLTLDTSAWYAARGLGVMLAIVATAALASRIASAAGLRASAVQKGS